MIGTFKAAARYAWAALRRIRWPPVSRPMVAPASPDPQPGPDMAALAALMMGGLIDPVDAVLIALIESDRHLDR